MWDLHSQCAEPVNEVHNNMASGSSSASSAEASPATLVEELAALITRIYEADHAAVDSRERAAQAAVDERKVEVERRRVEALGKSTQQACRDLQRSTKGLEDEAKLLRDSSAVRRSKLTGKFDKSIEDITAKMGEQTVEVSYYWCPVHARECYPPHSHGAFLRGHLQSSL